MARPDLARGDEPLVGVGRRHADVDDRDVRPPRRHLAQQLRRVAGLADDLDAGVGEQACEARPHEHHVVGDHYAHGISAWIRVPPPAGLAIRKRPPSAPTRSATSSRPTPRAESAPPIPSSAASTITASPSKKARTETVAASACRAAFSTASRMRPYAAASTGDGS